MNGSFLRKVRLISPFAVLVVALLGPIEAWADSFDDAVNHYLKGFDACQEANGLLRANRISAAKKKLNVYNKYLSEAEKMNSSIVKTNKRDMEGNIKFCRRVATNIEVEQATPFIDKAIAQCDLAQKALKEKKPDVAMEHLMAFKVHKEEAWNITEKLTDIFSIRNQVKRCQRLEKKILSAGKKQEASNLAIETVKEESQSYAQTCNQALTFLNVKSIDEVSIKNAGKSIKLAKSHKKNVKDETVAFDIFAANPGHEANALVAGNLKKGDVCLAKAEKLAVKKRKDLDKANKTLSNYIAALANSAKQCEAARSITKTKASDKVYGKAKKAYQRAQASESKQRKNLRKDKYYLAYSNSPKVKDINRVLSKVSNCLADTNKRMSRMFASLQAAKKALVEKKAKEDAARLAKASAADKAKIKAELAKKKKIAAAKAAKIAKAAAEARAAEVAVAKAAAKAAAEAAAKVAAEVAAKAASLASSASSSSSSAAEVTSRANTAGAISSITGVVTFNQISESVAVIYANGAEPSGDMVFAELSRNGFDQDVYVVSPGSKITIKNKDNTLHRIKATDDYNDISKNMVKLQPRQKRAVQVSWKADTVVEMRSNKGALSASYLANVPSGAFQIIEFLVGKSSHGFSFATIPSSADTATILIPNHDPIVISFALGGSQRIPLVKKGQQVGEVELELN
ncbi:hypothetical protein A9Q81_04355 [Gammaproteobacteria bacterium 42_54_T18]|nr:hypothetical protein A9Q81_04355 [Gammaproteobacteria bacterium 42_54_T18]